jgi:hypothetical protein
MITVSSKAILQNWRRSKDLPYIYGIHVHQTRNTEYTYGILHTEEEARQNNHENTGNNKSHEKSRQTNEH